MESSCHLFVFNTNTFIFLSSAHSTSIGRKNIKKGLCFRLGDNKFWTVESKISADKKWFKWKSRTLSPVKGLKIYEFWLRTCINGSSEREYIFTPISAKGSTSIFNKACLAFGKDENNFEIGNIFLGKKSCVGSISEMFCIYLARIHRA